MLRTSGGASQDHSAPEGQPRSYSAAAIIMYQAQCTWVDTYMPYQIRVFVYLPELFDYCVA